VDKPSENHRTCHPETPTRPEPAPEQSGGHDSIAKEPTPQARHVALPRDAEADGSAVVHVLGAAEPPGGTLRRSRDKQELGCERNMTSAMPEIRVAGVCERDVDLILLEEFVASSRFCVWFRSAIGFTGPPGSRLVRAERSATSSNGESDLEVTFESSEGVRERLLIENKIAAGFQPRQAERYKERGESYVRQELCHKFRTVLVAPERYFGADGSKKGFDAILSYEAIRDRLLQSSGRRAGYKADMLSKAIEKATHGWQLVEDEPVTRFWRRYWELVCEAAPDLELPEPSPKPSGSSFVYFKPQGLPPDVSLCHKVIHGHIDLQFAGMGKRIREMRTAYGSHLSQEMQIVNAEKSAAIRIKVSRLDMTDDLEVLESMIMEGIRTAQFLLEWYLGLAQDSTGSSQPNKGFE